MDAFGIVVIVVAIVAAVIAAASYWGSGRVYSDIGAGDLVMDRETRATDSAATAQEEIRQMLEALGGAGAAPREPGLREEVRQLVEASNARRLRQGRQPLDVDAEVERQLRDLGGDSTPGAG